jgi:hypothetical protein
MIIKETHMSNIWIYLSVVIVSLAGCPNGTPDTSASIIDPIWVDHGGGVVQFHTNNPEHYNKAPYSSAIEVPNNIYEVTVKKTSGSDDYAYGFLFCMDSDSYYRFFITVNQRYTIQKMVSGTWQESPPIAWSTSTKLLRGYNVENKLKIVRTDTDGTAKIEVYINDELTRSFTDDNPVNGTKARLTASVNTKENEGFPYTPVEVWFKY